MMYTNLEVIFADHGHLIDDDNTGVSQQHGLVGVQLHAGDTLFGNIQWQSKRIVCCATSWQQQCTNASETTTQNFFVCSEQSVIQSLVRVGFSATTYT